MILHRDQTSTRERLKKDAGISAEAAGNLQSLIDQNLIVDTHGTLSLSHQGKEAIAKIWSIHELTERLAFEDVPDEEKSLILKTLKKIQSNCEKVIPYEA